MTAQGLSRVAGGVALVAVLVIAGLVARSALRGPEPDFVPQLAGGPATGDMTGYLGRIDRAAHTIDVTEDLVGLRPVSLAVTDDTAVTVRGAQGTLADLSKDMPVRVFYEMRHDVKLATAIQVVEPPPAAQVVATPSAATVAVGPAEARPSEPAPVIEPRPLAATAPVGDALVVGEARPAPDPKPSAMSTAPKATPSVAAAPPTKVSRPVVPTDTVSRPAAPRRPADTEATDGTAAIDWLLGGARRR